jgi:hypothetical protein
MAIHVRSCTAFFLSLSMMVSGCTVDVQDPNLQEPNSGQPGSPAVTNTPPVIELVGSSVINIPLNTPFVDPGVVATDAEDGDLSSSVYSDSMHVNTSQPGEYEVTYRVTDSGNLAAQPVKRIVIVSAQEPEPVPSESEQPVVTVPSITDIKLIGFTNEQELVELQVLKDGSEIDLSLLSLDVLNVQADSEDVSKTGSVHFKLSGPATIDRWENNPIYTMAVETSSLRVSGNELPVGTYTLTVTPYSAPDMGGKKGSVKSISFKVIDKKIVSTVPKIAAIDLVAVSDGTGTYMPVTRITEGAEIDLSKIPAGLVNLIAISEDSSKTGSVQFSLEGPVTINRVENNVSYALADENQHLDVTKGGLPAGDYTLIVTPYSSAGATGEAGIPLIVNFSAVDTAITVPTEPVIEPPQAHGDNYTFQAGSDSQPGMDRAVSANDVFTNDAKFVVTKVPANGVVTMLDLGFFTYVPNAGFAGTDTFTYQIRQSGKSSSANVNIKVVAPVVSETASGFTVFKPSADSKVIYVSSSTGNDKNTCLSEAAPCKTIGAGFEKMRNGYPDHLYLKRGDVWRGERFVNFHSGRSADEPAVIAYYGNSGPRPRIENSQTAVHVFKNPIKNFHFIGLEFYAYKMDVKHAEFTGTNPADVILLGANENILFEDNKFINLEMVVHGTDKGNPANVTLRRNIWTGAYYSNSSYDNKTRPSNIYADNVSGLTIEENVFDFGGWHPSAPGAGANMYNHNIYVQVGTDGNKLLLKNNIITRGSSHGAQLRGGGLAVDNFFGRNAIGLMLGYWDPIPTGVRAHAFNNVITEGTVMTRGDKACSGGNLCTGAIWGLEFSAMGYADWRGEGNIISGFNDAYEWKSKLPGIGRVAIHRHKDQASTVQLKNNLTYKWSNDNEGTDQKYVDPGRTLGSYNQYLGGKNSFEDFMDVVTKRGVGTWDVRYTAAEINRYIRAGYEKQ